VRCAPPANQPTPAERDECAAWLRAELDLMPSVEVVVCLGAFAYGQVLRLLADRGVALPRPRPRFAHGGEVATGRGPVVLASYHPSQQNTFTGTLTEPMLDAVFTRARELLTG
jgi:uracil-DNA glycosylase family 4